MIYEHPECSLCFGANFPSRAERFGIDEESLLAEWYESLAEATGYDWHIHEDTPWILDGTVDFGACFNDNGKLIAPKANLRSALVKWLREPYEDSDDDPAPWLSDGIVGYAVIAALPDEVVAELELKESDFGNPVSHVPGVAFKGEPEVLTKALEDNNIPFRLVVEKAATP